jgi:cation diffusion facilitator CzcD-associated flavoprotein CzcO
VYQSTFSPNTQWQEEYATGPEIRRYWQSVARKYDLYSKIRFRTKVLGAYWQPQDAQWRLKTEDLETGQLSDETFDFVVTCIGHFNKWKIPAYPGIDKYKGILMHSSGWKPGFDPAGKRIATIGNGASGIQVTTEVRKTALHVDHYARSRTWIAGSFQPNAKERQDTPMYIDENLKEKFEKDPQAYLKYRKTLESTFWRAFGAQIADSEETQKTRDNFIELMRKRLGDDPSLLEKLVPDFPPHCKWRTSIGNCLRATW